MTVPPPSSRWDEIADLFDRALALPPNERRAWLASSPASDEEMRREVAAMLLSHASGVQLEIEEQLLSDRPTAFAPGATIGQYRIRSFLGRGGMGEVYLAERAGAGYEHLVALKLLRPTVAGVDAAARFRREQRILARLSHPAIAPLLDSGVTADGRPYLVLQYVDGVPITHFADERRLGIEDRLRLFVAVCRVVQYAHARLVIHRDLKPSNILVTGDGGVRLLDFGIAKVLIPEEEGEGLTRQAAPMTPERAAPEQLRGELPSTATDVWALGVLLTELLIARLPFALEGRSPSEIERRLSRQALPRPSAAMEELSAGDRPTAVALAEHRATTPERLRQRLRGDLDSVVSMALRWEPERRYASAGQFADDIERVLAGHPVVARPASVAYRLRRFLGRHPIGTTAAAVGLVALLVFAFAAVRQSARVARERDRASAEETKANAVVDLLVGILSGADPTEGASGATISIDDLLSRGETQAAGMASQPAIQARLWQTLGKIHLERSAFGKARELLQLALDRELELSPADAPQAVGIALDLARAEASLGDRSASAARLRSLVSELDSADRQAPRPDLLATALHQLAEIEPHEAGEQLALRALALRRELDPPQPVVVADSLNAVGVHALQRGDRRAAAEAFRESVALLVPALGEEHPYSLAVGSNLASVTSDLAEQEAFYRRMIDVQARRYGETSQQVATAWNNLGASLAKQGKLPEALAAFRRALEHWSLLHGPAHPQVLNTRSNIARALELSGDPASALVEFTGILAAVEIGEIEAEAEAAYRVQTALALLRLERLAEAAAMVTGALATLAGIVPETDPTRIGAHGVLGLVLLAQGNADAAERELAVADAACKQALAQADPQRATIAVLLGRARLAQGRKSEGLALMSSGFDVYSRWGLTHPDDIAAARRALAVARQATSP